MVGFGVIWTNYLTTNLCYEHSHSFHFHLLLPVLLVVLVLPLDLLLSGPLLLL